jgi:Tol biopolymer transport system component
MLSPLPNQSSSAFATFPGQNGKIAFDSWRDGNTEIYVMNADGSNQTQLINVQDGNFAPDWSPDGTKIAFTRDVGNVDIYVMNADGSGQTRLTNNPALQRIEELARRFY